ncbi:hypothetical protein PILCRDRAFT_10258 [Piloderma croceum F 1598]|uniref:Uncharacterized protein n=1 Tax=Piloderma croceum (strain F 1598) TaxID=765440 RepID=A0A0C3BQ26_PILCF|nr:hypothetical protein PILCRDRAFT_10258 [Piloderma croceum F 1598]
MPTSNVVPDWVLLPRSSSSAETNSATRSKCTFRISDSAAMVAELRVIGKRTSLLLSIPSPPLGCSSLFQVILGEAAVVANAAFDNEMGVIENPPTWQALVRRDIFDPLGLNGSFFTVTPVNKAHVAVSSLNSYEVRFGLLEPMSCSSGQMSSLFDYMKIMQTILDPTRLESFLPSHIIREWLEIEKIYDSYERPIRIFEKLCVLGDSRSVFATRQATSRSIYSAISHVGSHFNEGGVDDGSLWILKLVLNGTDVLRLTQGVTDALKNPMPITLWSTGRRHEFRMLFGVPDEFCEVSYSSYWVSIDSGFSRGYPMDLLYFRESQDGLVLHVPYAGVTLVRR